MLGIIGSGRCVGIGFVGSFFAVLWLRDGLPCAVVVLDVCFITGRQRQIAEIIGWVLDAKNEGRA